MSASALPCNARPDPDGPCFLSVACLRGTARVPASSVRKNEAARPPSRDWKAGMLVKRPCEETLSKGLPWLAHEKNADLVNGKDTTRVQKLFPPHHDTHMEPPHVAAPLCTPRTTDDVFRGNPSMGPGGRCGGRQQARIRACSLIFTKPVKRLAAGIFAESTATANRNGVQAKRSSWSRRRAYGA